MAVALQRMSDAFRLNPLLSEAVFSIWPPLRASGAPAACLNPLLSEAVFSIPHRLPENPVVPPRLNPLLSEAVFSMTAPSASARSWRGVLILF